MRSRTDSCLTKQGKSRHAQQSKHFQRGQSRELERAWSKPGKAIGESLHQRMMDGCTVRSWVPRQRLPDASLKKQGRDSDAKGPERDASSRWMNSDDGRLYVTVLFSGPCLHRIPLKCTYTANCPAKPRRRPPIRPPCAHRTWRHGSGCPTTELSAMSPTTKPSAMSPTAKLSAISCRCRVSRHRQRNRARTWQRLRHSNGASWPL